MNALADFESAAGQNLLGATVTRIRGIILATPAASQTGSSDFTFAGLISTQGESVTAMGPVDSPYRDWMLWEPFTFTDIGLAGAVPGAGSPAFVRMVDVKSMRKLEEVNQQLTWYYQPRTDAWVLSYNLSVGLLLA